MRISIFIAALLTTIVVSATALADCGCGGEGDGKLKPDSRPEIVVKA